MNQVRFACVALAIGCCVISSTATAITYHVRVDGGDSVQCVGTTNAPYPGTGNGQACAWAHPFWALDGEGAWRIQGGDELVIHGGSYALGYGAPNTAWCEPESAFACHLPPLPSGLDTDRPTRLVGAGWDSGCPNRSELWGTQRSDLLIDLTSTSNAVVACLDLADHSGCVEFHADPATACQRDSYPYGDWAASGVVAADSANVLLRNLNIHGLAVAGIHAGRLRDWRIDNVRIAANGWVGWDGDIDGVDSNSGSLVFKRWTVEWNGCAESYPQRNPLQCWAQTAGGYGDGVGTGATGGHWIIEDAVFRHNTSDGLDLLYVREPGSQIEVRRTQAYGNAGDQLKVNGSAVMANNLVVSDCGFFEGKSFTYDVDACRAGGSAVAFTLRQGTRISVVNSTIAGQGDCLMIGECEGEVCDGSEQIIVQNNIFHGYPEFADPSDTTCYLWLDQDRLYQTETDYNVIFDTKLDGAPVGSHDILADPLLMNSSMATFDGRLQSGSPAVDTGLPVGSLAGMIPNHDLRLAPRPNASGVDRGALEQGAASVPDVQINAADGPLSLSREASVSLTVSLDPRDNAGLRANWWLVADTPVGWYGYVYPDSWRRVAHLEDLTSGFRGQLFGLPPFEVLDIAGLWVGRYVVYFGVDTAGYTLFDLDRMTYDRIELNVGD